MGLYFANKNADDRKSRPQAGSSLDHRTLLDHRLHEVTKERDLPVSVNLYPTAAEAVIVERWERQPRSSLEDIGPDGDRRPSDWADLDEEERDRRN